MGSTESGPDVHQARDLSMDRDALLALRDAFLSDEVARVLLDALPDVAVVLNEDLQLLACNRRTLQLVGAPPTEDLIGLRPGDLLECVGAEEGLEGCGSAPQCEVCGGRLGVLECLRTRRDCAREYRLRTRRERDGGALELDAHASPLQAGGHDLVLLILRDISAEKRREVLERTFFHDMMNTLTALRAVALFLADPRTPPDQQAEDRTEVVRLTDQIVEEVAAHRHLLAAENGELHVLPSLADVDRLVGEVVSAYRSHSLAHGRGLAARGSAGGTVETDVPLVRRALSNLVKNALEAIGPGQAVTVEAERSADRVRFAVRNPGVIPPEVQRQIFQRSFSTKARHGRGIGTYSVKLLVERYLGGRVWFESAEPEGTAFFLELPAEFGGVPAPGEEMAEAR